jgi:4-carboxymuconolactone decarboxylase
MDAPPRLAALSCGVRTVVKERAEDRMPPVRGGQLTEAQRNASAAFAAARHTDVFGPFVPLLRSPELMSRVRELGDYLRFKSALPPRLSEWVILITAREWTQQYEWNVHHPIAIQAGLSPAVTDALAEGRRPLEMSEEEEILYDFCIELHRHQNVSDPTYQRAVSRFGERGVVDAVGICGYYTFLAMVLNVARTPLPVGQTPALALLPR